MNPKYNPGALDAATLLAAAAAIGAVGATPATAQLATSKVIGKQAIATPLAKSVTFQGSESAARSQAASIAAADPVKAKLLTAALDAARGRPGFNPAAISVSVKFNMKTGAPSAGALR